MNDESSTWGSAARGAVALFVLGLIGVVALAIHSVPTLRAIPELAVLSYPTLMLVAAANSTIFLVIFVTLGTVTAPRTGLHSHVFAWASGGTPDWDAFRRSLPLAVGLGAVLFVLVTVLDVVFAPVYRTRVSRTRRGGGGAPGPARVDSDATALRRNHGGDPTPVGRHGPDRIRLLGGLRNRIRERTKTPPAAVMWVAIVASAVAFGVGHPPALASTFDLTIALIIRTVLLNAIVGVALGWLFWQRSLETAMVAHAAFTSFLSRFPRPGRCSSRRTQSGAVAHPSRRRGVLPVFETGKTVHFEARLAVDDGDVGRVVDSGEEVRYEPSVSTDRVTSAYPRL